MHIGQRFVTFYITALEILLLTYLLTYLLTCVSDHAVVMWMYSQVVLRDGETAEHGKIIAEDLMTKLEIDRTDLLSGAYMDMLLNNSRCTSGPDS